MIWPADDPMLTMWDLTPDDTGPCEARHAMRAWLSGHGVNPDDGDGSDILTVVNELVTNAVVHGAPPVLLSARVSKTSRRDIDGAIVPEIVITVTDGGGKAITPPRLQSDPDSFPDLDSEHKRGLWMVFVATDWQEFSCTWNATQVKVGFGLPGLPVPAPRRYSSGAPSNSVGGTRTGGHPLASLSANTF